MQDHLQNKRDSDPVMTVASSALDDSHLATRKTSQKGAKVKTGQPETKIKGKFKGVFFGFPTRKVMSATSMTGTSVAAVTIVVSGRLEAPASDQAPEAGTGCGDTPRKGSSVVSSSWLASSCKRSGSFVGGLSVGGSVVGLDCFGVGMCSMCPLWRCSTSRVRFFSTRPLY